MQQKSKEVELIKKTYWKVLCESNGYSIIVNWNKKNEVE